VTGVYIQCGDDGQSLAGLSATAGLSC